jgi:hypothetical protein
VRRHSCDAGTTRTAQRSRYAAMTTAEMCAMPTNNASGSTRDASSPICMALGKPDRRRGTRRARMPAMGADAPAEGRTERRVGSVLECQTTGITPTVRVVYRRLDRAPNARPRTFGHGTCDELPVECADSASSVPPATAVPNADYGALVGWRGRVPTARRWGCRRRRSRHSGRLRVGTPTQTTTAPGRPRPPTGATSGKDGRC